MGNIYDVWKAFFVNLSEIENLITPAAKKCGVSKEAALLLLTAKYCESQELLNISFLNELTSKGLAISRESSIELTSKGQIIAKSIETELSKY